MTAKAAASPKASFIPTASTTIVISEVDADTPLSGTDTANEWFELQNVSGNSITLSGWTITDNTLSDQIPTVTLQAGGHVIVAATAAGFASEHANFSGTVLTIADGAIGSGLANAGDVLTLKDNTGAIVDAVSWGSNTTAFNPAAGADTPTNTNQRNAAGTDTDTNADWTRNTETPNGDTSGMPTQTNPSGTGQASPSSVLAGNSTLLTVAVTPGANPASTNLSVSGNLTAIGGSSEQQFFDDGSNGDVTAGDNIFSYFATVSAATAPGNKSLQISISDGENRTGNAAIAVTVTSNSPTNPTGTGSASPSSVQPGNSTLLAVTVNPGTNPASSGITVSADLSSIDGLANQQFFDDGSNGDATAGDNIFSYLAAIPANTATGTKTLSATISDSLGRTGTAQIVLNVGAQPDASEHLALGNPTNAVTDVNQPFNYLLSKPQYAVSYHRDRGIPNWVSWHLDSTWIGSAARQNDFRPDSTLPAGWYQVLGTDYSGSGFDRGHHTPSADRTRSVADNSATFLMTNMMPQAPDNNQGPWEQLESYSRTLLGSNELYIVAGGTGVGGTGSNGGVTNTIANGHVTVPSQTWKVIVVLPVGDNDVSRVNTNTRTIAVIMPNTQGIRTNQWQQYIVSVDQVEALTGYNFFSNVPAAIQNQIEARIDGSSCSFSLQSTSANAPASGSTGSVGVTAGTGCGYTATSNDSWITITSGAAGSGNGTVNYSVAANGGATARTGTLTIGGNTFTITQAANAASSYSISGVVAYGITPVGQQAGAPVQGVALSSGANNPSVATDANGAYQIANLTPGASYTVTPSKTGSASGISAFDATLVLRCVAAAGNCALTANQQLAADANGSGDLSAFDATLILRYVAAGTANSATGQTGTWKFAPVSRDYPTLSGSQTGQNYAAILVGEVSGDWMPAANAADGTNAFEARQKSSTERDGSAKTDSVGISFDAPLPGANRGGVIVPVILNQTGDAPISAFNFDVQFDRTLWQPAVAVVDQSGTLAGDCSIVTDSGLAGRIGIAGSCPKAMLGSSGTLLYLRFGAAKSAKRNIAAPSFVSSVGNAVFEDSEGRSINTRKINR